MYFKWFVLAGLLLIGMAFTELANANVKPYKPPTDIYIEVFKCGKLAYLILVETDMAMTWAKPAVELDGIIRTSLISSSLYYRITDKEGCQ